VTAVGLGSLRIERIHQGDPAPIQPELPAA
jgi:hypothetical protein